MKIICTTERVVNENTSCRKEYCCKKMEKAMENREKDGHTYYSTFDIDGKDKVTIQTHSSYDYGSIDEEVKFCLFCGKPVKVEREHVDNTGLPPKEPVKAALPKKKRWWQRR